MADPSPVALSAPAYEPEKWNSAVTPERLAQFLADNNDSVLKVSTKYASNFIAFPGKPGFDTLPHDEKAGKLKSLVDDFNSQRRLFKDDLKLAEHYRIDPKDIAKTKEAFTKLREDFGYQEYATCFTYAMNDHDGIDSWWASETGRPGGRANAAGPIDDAVSNKDYPGFKAALMKGLIADGATEGGMDAKPREGFYRVAVYTLPNELVPKGDNSAFDYHFVRENRDGGWSHKFGTHPVTDTDNAGQKISDPRSANLGGYEFIGFVYVPEGGLDVGSPAEPKSKPGTPDPKPDPIAAQVTDLDAMTAQVLQNMRKPPEPQLEPERAPQVAVVQPKVSAFSV